MSQRSFISPRAIFRDQSALFRFIHGLNVYILLIFTARKRSLGQGNVFTRVLLLCSQGDLHPGGSASGGGLGRPPLPTRTMGYGQQAGGTHPTGMHTSYDIYIYIC